MNTGDNVNTIMFCTKCSGGCFHCPFGNTDVPALELEVNRCIQLIEDSDAELHVISGGEPFEHSKIDKLLLDLQGVSKPFRIASGGHVFLQPFMSLLEKLKFLTGISIGTDIFLLSSSSFHRNIWLENMQLLRDNKIPFSITISLLKQFELPDFENLLQFLNAEKIIPQFIYVRYNEFLNIAEYTSKISKYLRNAIIIEDDISKQKSNE